MQRFKNILLVSESAIFVEKNIALKRLRTRLVADLCIKCNEDQEKREKTGLG